MKHSYFRLGPVLVQAISISLKVFRFFYAFAWDLKREKKEKEAAAWAASKGVNAFRRRMEYPRLSDSPISCG